MSSCCLCNDFIFKFWVLISIIISSFICKFFFFPVCCYFPNVFYILFFLVISCWLNSNSFLLVSEEFAWHSHFDLNPEPLKFIVYLFRNQVGSRNLIWRQVGDRNSPEIYFPSFVNPACNHEVLCDLQTLQGWRGGSPCIEPALSYSFKFCLFFPLLV